MMRQPSLFDAPPKTGGFHAPRLRNSPPTQRFLALLIMRHDSGGVTTMEAILGAHIVAVNSHASALKANGIRYDCFHDRKSAERADVYRYRLVDRFQAVSTAINMVPDDKLTPELRKAIYGN